MQYKLGFKCTCVYSRSCFDYSLVVEHDVGQPDVLGWHIKLCDAAILRGIPLEFMILPFVLQPHVGG